MMLMSPLRGNVAGGGGAVGGGTVQDLNRSYTVEARNNATLTAWFLPNGKIQDGAFYDALGWYEPNVSNIGNNFYLNGQQINGPVAVGSVSCSAASSPATQDFFVVLSTDAAGVNVVGAGTITLTAIAFEAGGS